jgi:hypothetical protein
VERIKSVPSESEDLDAAETVEILHDDAGAESRIDENRVGKNHGRAERAKRAHAETSLNENRRGLDNDRRRLNENTRATESVSFGGDRQEKTGRNERDECD